MPKDKEIEISLHGIGAVKALTGVQERFEQAINRFSDAVGVASGVENAHELRSERKQGFRIGSPGVQEESHLIGTSLPLRVTGDQFLLEAPVLSDDAFKSAGVVGVLQLRLKCRPPLGEVLLKPSQKGQQQHKPLSPVG